MLESELTFKVGEETFEAGPGSIEKLKRVAEQYGNEIVGPPLQPKTVA